MFTLRGRTEDGSALRDGLEMLEQLLAAVFAELKRRRLIGGRLRRAGEGFAHQGHRLLEALVEGGELGVLRELLVQGGGFGVGQFAQQERGETGLKG